MGYHCGMEQLLNEDIPKYDMRHKFFLIAAPILAFAFGLLFFVDGYCCNVLPDESEASSRIGAAVFLATTAIVLAVYWSLRPKRFSIFDDRVEIRFGLLRLNIVLGKIKEARAAAGRMTLPGFGCVTSSSNIVEISITNGFNVRISPTNRDLFLKSLDKAMNPEPVEPDPLQLLK